MAEHSNGAFRTSIGGQALIERGFRLGFKQNI